ncbi:MAG: DUF4112 domain-containing protein [Fuerstia sp.]|nr:DUF4112 domain-containing protein [Fuerstiella sp.]
MNSTQPLEPELIDKRFAATQGPIDLEHLKLLARLMDSAFEIPGLRMRFGLDAILGLLPGVGDLVASLVSLYILQEAQRRGVSRVTLTRMSANILIDWLVGSIPLAGDAFDVVWKSNQKNVALLIQHESSPATRRRRKIGDWFFLAFLISILLTVLAGSLTLSYFIIVSLMRGLSQN